ncbi:MAG: hypothetical protein SVK08_00855 [Halobacteriota archaeon]|nr:hypothetical protein [Halobacteriota archaeon]
MAVQRLEGEVNKTLAASTQQSAKRQTSNQVPFILDLTVVPGFRQATVQFSAPPGLGGAPQRQLLFYELQHDTDAAFSNPTIIQTPNTNLHIAGLGQGETRSFRARVVSTLNQVSRFSDTVTVTLAQNKIQATALIDSSVRLTQDIGKWQTVLDNVFQPVDAKACINIQTALACPHFDVERKDSGGVTRQTFHGGPAMVQLRWLVGPFDSILQDFVIKEKGIRCILSARPGYTDEASDLNSIRTPTAFGTFMLPFYRPEAGALQRVVLQAAKMPGSSWKGPTSGREEQTSDPILFTRRGQIIEVLTGF